MQSRALRALVVDDSPIYRSLLVGGLREIPGVDCTAVAQDGAQAICSAAETPVDLILLDVEMPIMNGLAAIPKLREACPDAAIVMVSALTVDGADITVAALHRGAFDFITKPRAKAGEDGFAALREPLERVVGACRERPLPGSSDAQARPLPPVEKVPRTELVAIGVSTGGPSALAELIPRLPAQLTVPVLIVQHMPPRFTASLTRSLSARSALRVREAEPGLPLRAGEVVIARGGEHLEIDMVGDAPCCVLSNAPPVNSFRPSVDVSFKSIAARLGAPALGLVMTGMGSDGLEGARALRAAGGYTLAQAEASCAVFGMPRALIEAGEADEVIPLCAMARRVAQIVGPR